MKRNMLDAAQAAKRLGVKPQTLYAYVSRGLLTRTLADDGRRSLFAAHELEALARRGRPRREQRGGVEVSLGTAITEIAPSKLSYRGHDAIELARSQPFEAVAELLWTGALPSRPRWRELEQPQPLVRRSARLLPDYCFGVERFAAVAAVLAARQPLRVDLSLANVSALARLLIASFVHALPAGARARPGGVAQSLWPRLSRLPATPARVAALDCALCLLADHELASSTLAARVAASTRADPFFVVIGGLGTLAGPLHGKAATGLQRLLLEAAREPSPALAGARALQSTLTGFAHPVYADGDPRARALLEVIAARGKTRAVLDAVEDAGRRQTGGAPNIDFALAALAYAMEMPLGASEAIFAIARTAGLIAHALEEYGERPLRFRARAVFTGATAPRARRATSGG
ncbi:MAG: citrate synthase [Polyangiales bacterium]